MNMEFDLDISKISDKCYLFRAYIAALDKKDGQGISVSKDDLDAKIVKHLEKEGFEMTEPKFYYYDVDFKTKLCWGAIVVMNDYGLTDIPRVQNKNQL